MGLRERFVCGNRGSRTAGASSCSDNPTSPRWPTTSTRTLAADPGCGAAWQRTCFGSRGSAVQIRPSRLVGLGVPAKCWSLFDCAYLRLELQCHPHPLRGTNCDDEKSRCVSGSAVGGLSLQRKFGHRGTSNDGCPCTNSDTDHNCRSHNDGRRYDYCSTNHVCDTNHHGCTHLDCGTNNYCGTTDHNDRF